MTAKQGKLIPGKQYCDRCRQGPRPVHECSFSFREGYDHWKALWQARTGKRLTNRRKVRLKEREEDQLDLRALSGIVYFMDLCGHCWNDCSVDPEDRLANEFPTDTWERLLKSPSAEKVVAAKVTEGASTAGVRGLAR